MKNGDMKIIIIVILGDESAYTYVTLWDQHEKIEEIFEDELY